MPDHQVVGLWVRIQRALLPFSVDTGALLSRMFCFVSCTSVTRAEKTTQDASTELGLSFRAPQHSLKWAIEGWRIVVKFSGRLDQPEAGAEVVQQQLNLLSLFSVYLSGVQSYRRLRSDGFNELI